MYYEEEFIDGVWYWRSTPDGEWAVKKVQTSKADEEKWRSPTGYPIASHVTDKLPMRGEQNNDVQAALSNSEQILIDALKFYATKEHWMSNTENGQPFTLCALKHALDYAGWVHAHGQLQRWAIAKHGEANALAQQQPDAEVEILKNEIRRLKRLFHLSEECSEVIKVASKSARFGENYHNPSTSNTNKHELKQECADLCVVVGDNVDCTDTEFSDMTSSKRAKIKKWMDVEEKCLEAIARAEQKEGK